MVKYNILDKITIERWIKVYNNYIDIENTNFFTEVSHETVKVNVEF